MSKQFQVEANGTVFGIYEADSEQAARDACAVDAGYKSEADMVSQLGQTSELVATEKGMSKQYSIEVAYDNPEAAQFVQWLNEQGHTASVGRIADNSIDGRLAAADEEASKISNDLWAAYCNS